MVPLLLPLMMDWYYPYPLMDRWIPGLKLALQKGNRVGLGAVVILGG